MPSCQEASKLISKAQDQRLSLREKTALWMHEAICSSCREFHRTTVLLRKTMRNFANRQTQDREK